ncbi:MAG TPA: DNA methyltransferase [Anaerolineaceae bacterium]|nr:DNA methyltransferase [Anaerolineaceae bacterium]HQH86410.1 DNA methyltransferase [Anaerolineaceae bacterium]
MEEIQPQNFSQENTSVWDFPVRGAWATHKPDYRGNFAPQIPRNVILNYSEEGEIVLDPMVGSGTSIIEARLLNRNAIGYDINQNAVDIASERIAFNINYPAKQEVRLGNAQKLPENDNSIDLIVTHPPYLNLVTYSDGKNPDDFSSISSIPKFLDSLEVAIREMFRVLKPNHFCAILMGDTRKGQHYIPLSYFVLQRCLRSGFVLKEEIIKTQHNTTYGHRWSASAKHYKFYLIMHEHLFIFRKPGHDEDLSRIRYSTWKGVQKTQSHEIEEEWQGLLNWDNKRKSNKST